MIDSLHIPNSPDLLPEKPYAFRNMKPRQTVCFDIEPDLVINPFPVAQVPKGVQRTHQTAYGKRDKVNYPF